MKYIQKINVCKAMYRSQPHAMPATAATELMLNIMYIVVSETEASLSLHFENRL